MIVTFTEGHLGAGEEIINAPVEQVETKFVRLLNELKEADDEHYQIYLKNLKSESITVYDNGLFSYSSPLIGLDSTTLYYKPQDLADALRVLTAFVLCESEFLNLFIPTPPAILTNFQPKEASYQYPLHHAANRGDVSLVEKLVKSGLDVNQRDSDGATPLMHAAIEGHYSICEFLLKNGANPSLEDNDGEGIRSLASEYSEILSLLEKYDPNGGV